MKPILTVDQFQFQKLNPLFQYLAIFAANAWKRFPRRFFSAVVAWPLIGIHSLNTLLKMYENV